MLLWPPIDHPIAQSPNHPTTQPPNHPTNQPLLWHPPVASRGNGASSQGALGMSSRASRLSFPVAKRTPCTETTPASAAAGATVQRRPNGTRELAVETPTRRRGTRRRSPVARRTPQLATAQPSVAGTTIRQANSECSANTGRALHCVFVSLHTFIAVSYTHLTLPTIYSV